MFKRMMRWAALKGWDQTDLANRLCVSPQNVTNWKVRGVPPARYAQIAALFGRSVEQLIGEAPEGDEPIRLWPYAAIDEGKFRSLPEAEAVKIEAVILLGAAQLGLDVKKDG